MVASLTFRLFDGDLNLTFDICDVGGDALIDDAVVSATNNLTQL